jgi:acetyltransferase
MDLAKETISRTKVSRLLDSFRNVPAADRREIELTLVKASRLVCDVAQIAEMEINPILADENGTIALDARIRIEKTDASGESRLAIRPYPTELEETVKLADGSEILLRPIRPEDGDRFREFYGKLSPEDIRFRFLHPMKSISPELSARLTQIDYDREMALVLAPKSGNSEICGVVRISASPDMEKAEFAIVIRCDMTGQGLGPLLLRRIVEYSKKRGIGTIYGEVLSDNRSMLRLAEALGFEKKPVKDDPGVMHVFLPL